jgi:fluoride exporter
MIILLIAVGGFIGAVVRFILSNKYNREIPFGTLAVNISGSFFLGYLFYKGVSQTTFAFLGSGFCGAFTTFSTLNLEAVHLMQKKRKFKAYTYIVGSYSLGIICAYCGYLLAK